MRDNKNKFVFKRILAFFIDYGILTVFIIIQFYFFGVPEEGGILKISGLPAFAVFLFWFLITICFEQFFGATIGNLLNKIKPSSISDEGGYKKLSFIQSLKRHLLVPIDLCFFGIVALITITSTREGQRLGDVWAKTHIIAF